MAPVRCGLERGPDRELREMIVTMKSGLSIDHHQNHQKQTIII